MAFHVAYADKNSIKPTKDNERIYQLTSCQISRIAESTNFRYGTGINGFHSLSRSMTHCYFEPPYLCIYSQFNLTWTTLPCITCYIYDFLLLFVKEYAVFPLQWLHYWINPTRHWNTASQLKTLSHALINLVLLLLQDG